MRNTITWLLAVVLLPSAAPCVAASVSAVPLQDDSGVAQAAEEPLWEPPEEVEKEPEAPPAEPGERPPRAGEHRPRPPLPAGQRPRAEPRMGGPRRPPLPELMDHLLPLIAQQRPDLAERLRDLRANAPEQFRRVLVDALAMRFEEALEREEHRLHHGERPAQPGPPGHGRIEGRGPERHSPREAHLLEMRELQRRNEEFEQRSMELARHYRELCERREPELEAERDEVRRQIEETVHEHFELRTELRRTELRFIEIELDRLHEEVERIRRELERRDEAHRAIVEGRIRQLVGEGAEGW
jgi:hypothetical protein